MPSGLPLDGAAGHRTVEALGRLGSAPYNRTTSGHPAASPVAVVGSEACRDPAIPTKTTIFPHLSLIFPPVLDECQRKFTGSGSSLDHLKPLAQPPRLSMSRPRRPSSRHGWADSPCSGTNSLGCSPGAPAALISMPGRGKTSIFPTINP